MLKKEKDVTYKTLIEQYFNFLFENHFILKITLI